MGLSVILYSSCLSAIATTAVPINYSNITSLKLAAMPTHVVLSGCFSDLYSHHRRAVHMYCGLHWFADLHNAGQIQASYCIHCHIQVVTNSDLNTVSNQRGLCRQGNDDVPLATTFVSPRQPECDDVLFSTHGPIRTDHCLPVLSMPSFGKVTTWPGRVPWR
jgi:hypothetical protein